MRRCRANASSRIRVMKPAGDVLLVRRLVSREAHVAMDAKERAPGIADDLRRHRRETYVHFLGERGERTAQLGLVRLAVAREPLAVVVAAKRAEETECCGTKAGELGRRHGTGLVFVCSAGAAGVM